MVLHDVNFVIFVDPGLIKRGRFVFNCSDGMDLHVIDKNPACSEIKADTSFSSMEHECSSVNSLISVVVQCIVLSSVFLHAKICYLILKLAISIGFKIISYEEFFV